MTPLKSCGLSAIVLISVPLFSYVINQDSTLLKSILVKWCSVILVENFQKSRKYSWRISVSDLQAGIHDQAEFIPSTLLT